MEGDGEDVKCIPFDVVWRAGGSGRLGFGGRPIGRADETAAIDICNITFHKGSRPKRKVNRLPGRLSQP